MNGKIRRVVTGHDEQGRAVVLEDGYAPNVRHDAARPGYFLTQLWQTPSAPAPIDNGPDPTLGPVSLTPPPLGTVVRIIEFPPAGLELRNADEATAKQAFSMFGGQQALTGHGGGKQRHPFMHRTETIDYAVVLSGEITMLLDESEVTLKAGEILIQRGTNHAWTNRTDEPARVLFVLIDGKFDPAIAQLL
ncbi:MAG: cupin domain-containing protein [Pigmentiphaga sp.]|uniref:cupin domain-containing protein n=1 Tax=Pigmentiphaga sp. TaxID=1977564 RepID=UPI0029AE0F07|nr:cupin domain-containing protein [Pigmentiphaga sp.]MDX3906568.1 cupin domain-containing protein [Pigmentiphaga sp.]